MDGVQRGNVGIPGIPSPESSSDAGNGNLVDFLTIGRKNGGQESRQENKKYSRGGENSKTTTTTTTTPTTTNEVSQTPKSMFFHVIRLLIN